MEVLKRIKLFDENIQFLTGINPNEKFNNSVLVSISETLLAIWSCNDNYEVEKLFFQFALNELRNKSVEQLKNETIEISLTTDNTSSSIPFELNKISNPNGYTLQIDKAKCSKNQKIGF